MTYEQEHGAGRIRARILYTDHGTVLPGYEGAIEPLREFENRSNRAEVRGRLTPEEKADLRRLELLALLWKHPDLKTYEPRERLELMVCAARAHDAFSAGLIDRKEWDVLFSILSRGGLSRDGVHEAVAFADMYMGNAGVSLMMENGTAETMVTHPAMSRPIAREWYTTRLLEEHNAKFDYGF